MVRAALEPLGGVTEPSGEGALYAATERPDDVRRLLAAFGSELDDSPPWGPTVLAEARKDLDAGSLRGAVWIDRAEVPIGWGGWHAPSEVGRRGGWLYLARPVRSEAKLGELFDRVDQWEGSGGPIVSLGDLIPGFSLEAQSRVFAPRGFLRASRRDMTFPPAAPDPVHIDATLGLRTVEPRDAAEVLDLMLETYAEAPIEQLLFAERRDRREDAEASVEALLQGKLGPFWSNASFAVVDGGRFLGATLVNEFHGPLITEVMVRPEARRRGIARALLTATVRAIRSVGRGPPRLVVTEGNDRAERLYRSFGFEDVRGSVGGIWLRREHLAYRS